MKVNEEEEDRYRWCKEKEVNEEQRYLGEGRNSCKGVPGGCSATNCAMPDAHNSDAVWANLDFSHESYVTLRGVFDASNIWNF